MKSVPYDTGKVKIGVRYQPPVNYPTSRDMEALQRGLLDAKLERRAEASTYMIGVIIFVVLGVVWVCR